MDNKAFSQGHRGFPRGSNEMRHFFQLKQFLYTAQLIVRLPLDRSTHQEASLNIRKGWNQYKIVNVRARFRSSDPSRCV